MDRYWAPKVREFVYAAELVESYFLRVSPPDGRWAAWIKYTFLIHTPNNHPTGECWCTIFDPEALPGSRVRAWKESFPLGPQRSLAPNDRIELGNNLLSRTSARGSLGGGAIAWELELSPLTPPSALLPRLLYLPALPTTKLTTPIPLGRTTGAITVGDRVLSCDGAQLSLGHNWGHRHTDSYVWGQAAIPCGQGFFFFEGCALPAPWTQAGEGPVIPKLTLGRARLATLTGPPAEFAFSGPGSWLSSRSEITPGRWRFDLRSHRHRLEGELAWQDDLVAGLRYVQPGGALRSCLNSMVARGSFRLTAGGRGKEREVLSLTTDRLAALEFLTPRLDHPFRLLV